MRSCFPLSSSVSTVAMDWLSGKVSECLLEERSQKAVSWFLTLVFFRQITTLAYLHIGDVFTVILAVIVAATAMTTIAPQIMALAKASSSADELFKTIDRKSPIDPLSGEGKIPDVCNGIIEIKDVSFAYPARPEITVLKKLTVSAPAGKTTALVGASGSGKSTIVGLIERWYDQASGMIYLDDTDIRELNLRWLRTNIRLVQQEPVLFSGTIYENVAFGLVGTEKANLPQDEQRKLVEKACKDTYAEEFIKRLPKVGSPDLRTIHGLAVLTTCRATIRSLASVLRIFRAVRSNV